MTTKILVLGLCGFSYITGYASQGEAYIEAVGNNQTQAIFTEFTKDRNSPKVKFMMGEIIVKFKQDSPLKNIAHEIFEKGNLFERLTTDSYLDGLNQKFQVVKISKLHQKTRTAEEVKQKFPQRAKRAPKGALIPELGYTYKLEFSNKDLNILELCDAYAKDTNIEYAQPNYLATVQKDKEDFHGTTQ